MNHFKEEKFIAPKKKNNFVKYLRPIGVISLIVIAFVGGNYISRYGIVLGPDSSKYKILMQHIDDVDKFKGIFEVKDNLENLYDGEMNENDMVEGAIKGMTSALKDPYTVFMNNEEYAKLMESNASEFMGVGVIVTVHDEKVTVDSVIEGGPAEKAGIKAGDVIIEVDGNSIDGDLHKAVSYMSGPEKKSINIKIYRKDSNTLEFNVMRDKVKSISVKGEILNNNTGYIRLSTFNQDVSKDFENMLKELKNKGMKGLILDLRGNGGGYLTEAVNIASQFIPKGKTVTYRIDKYNNKEVSESIGGIAEGLPLVILTDGGTASASEVVTGALRDYKAATTVGTTTFGKGIVQLPFELKSGIGGLKVTVSKYYTPNGENIHKKGITPDYEVKLTEQDVTGKYDKNKDPQLQKAIGVLNGKLN